MLITAQNPGYGLKSAGINNMNKIIDEIACWLIVIAVALLLVYCVII